MKKVKRKITIPRQMIMCYIVSNFALHCEPLLIEKKSGIMYIYNV